MQDMFGVEVEVGDEVIYTNSGQGDSQLKLGVITEIVDDTAGVRNIATGKMQYRMKVRSEIASTRPVKQVYPENFI